MEEGVKGKQKAAALKKTTSEHIRDKALE